MKNFKIVEVLSDGSLNIIYDFAKKNQLALNEKDSKNFYLNKKQKKSDAFNKKRFSKYKTKYMK